MKKLHLALGVGALSLALFATGCTEASAPVAENATTSDSTSGTTANDADELFITAMIPHHQQAIEMVDIVLAKPDLDPAIVELAQQIKDAQSPELNQMLDWLQVWGIEYAPDPMAGMDHGSMDHSGAGMMSEADMAELTEADTATASRLFLEQMIMHHEGAVVMARTVLGNGQNQAVLDLAQRVIADQTAESDAMRKLLNEL